jgi:hypothetical protein
VVAASLDAMEGVLALPHDACRESALHGLGHLGGETPWETRRRAIVEQFLRTHGDLRPELARYAQAALDGCIQ